MSESKHFGPCDGFGYNGACSMCTGLVEPIATPTPPQVTMSDYEYVPDDENLASALDTAERLAKEADAKFCAAFGGDGETSAYWLTQAIAEIRVALAHPTIPTPPQGAVCGAVELVLWWLDRRTAK